MKKLLCMILVLVLLAGNASATIVKPHGVDVEFKRDTGIEAKDAVVLCRTLSAREDRYDNAKKVETLSFGDRFLTWERIDGWYNCYNEETDEHAWVRDYYVVVDPAYYFTDSQTPVYAYADTSAPRVALLGREETLTVIKETEDWVLVSIRGAAGWIRKTSRDRKHYFWFDPNQLHTLKSAKLTRDGETSEITDTHTLARISNLLTDVREMGASTSGCPFDIYLELITQDDQVILMEIASDKCSIYRVGGCDYRYGVSTHASNTELLDLFPYYMTAPQYGSTK